MPASRATSESKGTLIALIVFVVLFLAATVFAVWQLMSNEALKEQADTAQTAFDELATRSQYSAVKPLVESSGGSVRVTALGRLLDDLKYLAATVGGPEMADVPPAGVRPALEEEVNPLVEQITQALTNLEEADPCLGLGPLSKALLDERNMWQQRYLQTEMTLASERDQHATRVEEMQARLDRVDEELQDASRKAETTEATYQDLNAQNVERYEQVVNDLNAKVQEAQERENRAYEENRQLKAQVSDFGAEIKRLKERLRQFQPDPEMEMAAMEPDGRVVSVVPQEGIAYINLAKNDHIYRGLTFTVYDRYQAIQRSGKGKATLEVLEIMDTISKCRIVEQDPTDPIIENDIIANLIWSKDKKYQFCVIGDFDFNGDGRREPAERLAVLRLIESWGGQASDELTVDTDFLVVGEQPPLPSQPDEAFGGAGNQAFREAQRRREQYEEVFSNAKALGVPTFNLERFLYFIGYYQQARQVM